MARTKAVNKASASKKRKFAEERGVAHLLSLSQSIADAESQRQHDRIQATKAKMQAEHDKKLGQCQREKADASVARDRVAKPKSKAQIKAALKAQLRQKARRRKDRRKQLKSSDTQQDPLSPNKHKKSVSFALA